MKNQLDDAVVHVFVSLLKDKSNVIGCELKTRLV